MPDKKHKVIIYSTPSCVYCKIAKQYFKDNNVEYTEYNVMTDIAKREEMFKKTGQMGVPVIDIDGKIVIGFDEERIQSYLEL